MHKDSIMTKIAVKLYKSRIAYCETDLLALYQYLHSEQRCIDFDKLSAFQQMQLLSIRSIERKELMK